VRRAVARVDQAEAQRLFVLQQTIPFAELSLNSVARQEELGCSPGRAASTTTTRSAGRCARRSCS
jgi:hypothetical protein